MAAVATPWGKASVIEEVALEQDVGERAFSVLVQLLEDGAGRELVRFAYSSGGGVRRGPVTLRLDDLEQLGERMGGAPRLARLVRLGRRR